MPRGAQPKVAERENRMTYAAIRLFLENGYERTTTAAIAQAAGMSPSAFFAVFANKEALLLKLTKWMYEKQFAVTHELLGKDYDPVMFYAVEPGHPAVYCRKDRGTAGAVCLLVLLCGHRQLYTSGGDGQAGGAVREGASRLYPAGLL